MSDLRAIWRNGLALLAVVMVTISVASSAVAYNNGDLRLTAHAAVCALAGLVAATLRNGSDSK